MELLTIQTYQSPVIDYFLEQMKDINLIYYASEAADEMEFENAEEMHDAVKRSIELCLQANIPVDFNFKRIYTSSNEGIRYDWKLSVLAYRMVCLNGGSFNPNVARMQIKLIKEQSENR